MNVVLWVVAGLLAVAMLAVGTTKLLKPASELRADPRMGWSEDFSPSAIKAISALEILGAIGLILPAAVGVFPILAPVAAVGIALLMIGAAITHGRRKEFSAVATNIVLLLFAAFVAWGRLGHYAF